MKVVILGSAQDAGLPQLGCQCINCSRADMDPGFRRLPACLGVIDELHQRAFLIDATPAIGEQLKRLRKFVSVTAALDTLGGILLTHAHLGHYPGLLYLGREAAATRQLPVFASRRMADFLRANRPFSHLVERGEIAIMEFAAGTPFPLWDGMQATAVEVPHRNEDADTHAFLLQEGNRTLFYMPDVDYWTPELVAQIGRCETAVIDGTFFSKQDLPAARMASVPHPPMEESLVQLLLYKNRANIYFTHLNHNNPAADPNSPAHQHVRRAGFHIAAENQVITV